MAASHDGREAERSCTYLAPSGALISVVVGRGATWTTSAPSTLVKGLYTPPYVRGASTYDVSPDGKRFLMMKPTDAGTQASIVVVQNWGEELKRLLP